MRIICFIKNNVDCCFYNSDEHDEFRMSAGSSEAYPGQGSRESDVLSEEEEQIKLAMALSLATVQPSATSAAVPSVGKRFP